MRYTKFLVGLAMNLLLLCNSYGMSGNGPDLSSLPEIDVLSIVYESHKGLFIGVGIGLMFAIVGCFAIATIAWKAKSTENE
jgi:hypothetical protein